MGQDKVTKVTWPKANSPFPKTYWDGVRARAKGIVATMTLEQKVAQMTQANIDSITPEALKQTPLGSILIGGGAFLNGNKYASTEQWLAALDDYHAAITDTSTGQPGIPLMWGVDAVHGHNKIFGATVFPHNIGLGATYNPTLVKTVSKITAEQVLATGMDWTFSPCVSVVRDDRWGRTYESYSESPEWVSQLGAASVEGYQGEPSTKTVLSQNRIVATAKHFIGDGATEGGVDRGNTLASEAELASIHAPAYKAAIESGVLTIMASHNSWQGERLHGHRYLLTDILKQQMGFEGFVIGDWNSHALVDGCSNDHCPQAVNAGVDMFMVPNDWQAFIQNTVADVNAGRIPESRINDAVTRILSVKIHSGLLDAPKPSARPLSGKTELLDQPAIRTVARQAVRESAVLLKNNGDLLPLAPTANILMAGNGAHNIPMQTGGWTLSWQSTDTSNSDFPNGTSIYQGVKTIVEKAGGKVTLSKNGEFTQKPDVAIVVYGEPPYAEWQGDLSHLAYQASQPENAKLLEALKAQGIPTVSVFMSGRPLWVNRELNASDAFVAAWLPGTEGDGLAELLLADKEGKPRYDFTGRLSFSWPATADQTPLNPDTEGYAPLFKAGFGLDYQTSVELALLPAAFSATELTSANAEWMFDGKAVAPWEVHLQTPATQTVRYLSGLAQNGALTVIEADKATQGDALGGRWDGSAEATLALYNPGAYRSFKAWLSESSAIVFDARLLKASDKPVAFSLGCLGDACQAEVDLTTLVNTSPLNDWNSLSVALSCFDTDAFDFDTVRKGFGIKTHGVLELDITNVRIEPNMADKAGVSCH